MQREVRAEHLQAIAILAAKYATSSATAKMRSLREIDFSADASSPSHEVTTTRPSAMMMKKIGQQIDLIEHHEIVDIGKRSAGGELERDQCQQRGDAEPDAALDIAGAPKMRPAQTTISMIGTKVLIDIATIGQFTGTDSTIRDKRSPLARPDRRNWWG